MGGTLFVISGPSGAGKSTMCTRLRKEFSSLALSRSVTSRAPRHNEQDGVHYDFVDAERFRQMIEANAFVEWAEVHGNYYGTTRAVVDESLHAGNDLLFDIDYQGAAGIRAIYPDAVTVMLLPPSYDVLEKRLRARGTDSDAVIEARMKNARGEIAECVHFDYVIINDDLEQSYERLRSVFIAAQCRPHAQRDALAARFGVALPR